MDRQRVSRLAHTDHPIASPLSDDTVGRLLRYAVARGDERVLDLGCGGAEWLLRLLREWPDTRAEGVDQSAPALEHARATAADLGVTNRLELHQRDAAGFVSPHRFDVVFSVGASHAFGGLAPTLAAAREHLAPGGRVVVGDGFWQRTPTPAAREMLGDFADLHTTVHKVVADGWTPVHGHVSTRAELDEYEWAWTGSLASWALDHPTHPDSSAALTAATTHRTEWLRDYRDSLGFLCLVLRPTPTDVEPR